jgi:hypothetical protein
MAAKKTKRYIDVLEKIANGINNTVSRTHRMKPKDVTYKNQGIVFHRLFPDISEILHVKRPVEYMFKLNDKVRHSKFRSPFYKSYKGNYSEEVFVVSKLIPRSPPVYRLETLDGTEIEGTWYAGELIKVGEKNEIK